jgi:hypothetical protein
MQSMQFVAHSFVAMHGMLLCKCDLQVAVTRGETHSPVVRCAREYPTSKEGFGRVRQDEQDIQRVAVSVCVLVRVCTVCSLRPARVPPRESLGPAPP